MQEERDLIVNVRTKGISGIDCFAKTGIAVKDVLSMLDDEMSHEEILNYFPALTREHIKAALEYRKKMGA